MIGVILRSFTFIALIVFFNNEIYADEGEIEEQVKDNLETMILKLSDIGAKNAFSGFLVSGENFDMIDEIVANHGGISSVRCFNGHSSKVFFFFICHTTYENHKSGNGLHFYVFKENSRFIGTRFGVSDFFASKSQCLKDVRISEGLSAELRFTIEECE